MWGVIEFIVDAILDISFVHDFVEGGKKKRRERRKKRKNKNWQG